MLLGQELKFKNKLCNLKLGTFFSALPGLGASALSGRVGAFLETQMGLDRQATEPHPALRLRKARNCPSWGNFLSLLQQLTAMPRHFAK